MNMEAPALTDNASAEIHYDADTSGRPIGCLTELIRKRAYELFEARGHGPGHEMDDWLQAENEIKHHFNIWIGLIG